MVQGKQGQGSDGQRDQRKRGYEHADCDRRAPSATEAQEYRPDMPGQGAGPGKHFYSYIVNQELRHQNRNAALDYVDGAAGQPSARANFPEHVGCATVVVADAAYVSSQCEAGEKVGGGDGAYEVGQQPQSQPVSDFGERFHGLLSRSCRCGMGRVNAGMPKHRSSPA